MAKYRSGLPQISGGLFLTDGGLETTLIYHTGLELQDFAAFDLLGTVAGEAALRDYYIAYAQIADRLGTGLILESATWRANPDWGKRLGYDSDALAEANTRGIELLAELRRAYEMEQSPIVISGCIGPRGDGYAPGNTMSADSAERYHRDQLETFAGSDADMACALTMNYVEEAVGIAEAARRSEIPVAISFTVETDGNLPTGQRLETAIEQVDDQTSGYPCYYMINCAHPSHFDKVLTGDAPWLRRLRGVRANASRLSHAELDDAAELDAGDPAELARDYVRLGRRLQQLNVMGGCCGTDQRHIEAIATACLPLFESRARTV